MDRLTARILRIGDTTTPATLPDLAALADRAADRPIALPERLPAQLPTSDQPRFDESSVYPYLETNIDHLPMQFSQEPIPTEQSPLSVSLYGPTTPFRH